MEFDRCQVVRVVRVDIRRQDSALTCRLADTVLRGLLKYWPVTNSQKEVLFDLDRKLQVG